MDLLASEYGWNYSDILYKIYPDDFFLLSRQIKIRRVDGYIVDYMIASSSYSEDQSFIEKLIKTQRFMQGDDPNPQLDRAALDAFKQDFNKKPKPKV